MNRRSALEITRKRKVNSPAITRKRRAKAQELLSQSATFLDLPTEIRVTIYKLCFTGAMLFVNENGIDLKSSRARGEVARASKESYSEAMPVLYSMTTLVYHGSTKGPASVSLIPQYQKYVPQIVMRTSIVVPLSLQNLGGYKSLKNLRIDVGQLGEWIFRGQNMREIERLPAPGDTMLVSMIMRKIGIRCSNRTDYAYRKDRRGPVKIDDLKKLALSKNGPSASRSVPTWSGATSLHSLE